MNNKSKLLSIISLLILFLFIMPVYTSNASVLVYSSQFNPGISMNNARMNQKSISLDNGNIMLIGGHGPGFVSLSSAELYNPVANSFTKYTMNYSHDGSFYTKLQDGRYLIAGGSSDWGVPAYNTAEIYDPSANTFTPAGSMVRFRADAGITTLKNGQVLVAGAWWNHNDAHTYGELYDPVTNTFTAVGALNVPRANPVILPCDDGNAVVIGGYPYMGGPDVIEKVELYNKDSGTFTVLRDTLFMNESGWRVTDGKYQKLNNGMYLMLGYKADSSTVEYSFFLFDPSTKEIIKLPTNPMLPKSTSSNPVSLYSPVYNSANNKLYILTQDSQGMFFNILDMTTGILVSTPERYAMPPGYYLSGASINMLQNGNILISGGTTGDNFGALPNTMLVSFSSSTAPFAVQNTVPKNGEQNFSTTDNIVITFNEAITSGDTYNSITLKDASKNIVAITKSISSNVLTINPDNELLKDTDYTLTIPSGAVKNAGTETLKSDFSLSFRAVKEDEPVVFADAGLENAVRYAVNKFDGNITAKDMQALTYLDANYINIKSLGGIEYAVNLTSLSVSGNSITDITPLAGLTSLNTLNISSNAITDVTPISALTNLTSLDISCNNISDISSLDKLTMLNTFNAQINKIKDIGVTENYHSLLYLYLSYNSINDISPLVLNKNAGGLAGACIYIDNNQLDLNTDSQDMNDINYLSNNGCYVSYYPQKQALAIDSISPWDGDIKVGIDSAITECFNEDIVQGSTFNNITVKKDDGTSIKFTANINGSKLEIRPAENNNKFELNTHYTVTLPAGSIKQKNGDLETAENIFSFTTSDKEPAAVHFNDLQMEKSVRTFLNGYEGVITTTHMAMLHDFSPFGIDDITGIEYACNLRVFRLYHCGVTSLQQISNLTKLEEIDEFGCSISDLSPLSDLTSLKSIRMTGSGIKDISPLSKLTNIKTLDLSQNDIRDITPVASMINMEDLALSNNKIIDITPLQNLKKLKSLSLGNNQIYDISILGNLLNDGALRGGYIDLCENLLDITDGSNDRNIIDSLGIYSWVAYTPQKKFEIISSMPDDGYRGISKDADILVKNNTDISLSNNANNITLKKADGTKIACTVTASFGILKINPNSSLSPKTVYNVYIPEDSYRDLIGRPNAEYSFSFTTAGTEPIAVVIPDETLEKLIRKSLGKPTGTIYATDMAQLETLDSHGFFSMQANSINKNAINKESAEKSYEQINNETELLCINSLEGLEYALNLNTLSVYGSSISDLSPISDCILLKYLSLCTGCITNLEPINKLVNIESLYLFGNKIEDISALTNLTKIKSLDLSQNQISNIEALSSLKDVVNMYITDNMIKDVSPISEMTKLQSFSASNNKIVKTPDIPNLKDLSYFDMNNNMITDISSIVTNRQNSNWQYAGFYFDRNYLNLAPDSDVSKDIDILNQHGIYVYTGTQNTAPAFSIVSTKPAVDSSDASLNITIEVGFTNLVDDSSDLTGIKLMKGETEIPVEISISNNSIFIKPSQELSPLTKYSVIIPAGCLKDILGQIFEGSSFSFTTSEIEDKLSPKILITLPADKDVEVPLDTVITIIFDEAITESTVFSDIKILDGNNSDVGTSTEIKGNVLEITADSNSLEYNQTYSVIIPACSVKDLANNEFEGSQFSFTTIQLPEIIKTTPAADEEKVSIDSNIVIEFNTDIQIGSQEAYDSISVLDQSYSPVEIEKNISGKTLTLNPVSSLITENMYTVLIPQDSIAVKDKPDNLIFDDYKFSFKTSDDMTSPKVVAAIPENGAKEVDGNIISIEFSEEVQEGENFDNIVVKDNKGGIADIEKQINENILEITLTDDFVPNRKYTVTIPAGAVSDMASTPNTLEEKFEFSFDSIKCPEVLSAAPLDGSENVKADSKITVNFNMDILQGDDFDSITLTDDTDEVIDITKAIKGNVLTITPDKQLKQSTVYTLVIPSAAITADDESLAYRNMFNDFSLSFKTEKDSVPPSIIKATPLNNSKDFRLDKPIIIKFSEDIQILDENNIFLVDSANNKVDVSIDASDNILAITPSELLPGTKYTLTILSGSIGDVVKEGDPNTLSSTYKLSFTTVVLPAVKTAAPVDKTDKNGNTVPANAKQNSAITITFNMNVFSGEEFNSIVLSGGKTEYTSNNGLVIKISGAKLTINAPMDLDGNTKYSVFIPKNAIKDKNGLTLTEDYEFSFTTAQDKTAPKFVSGYIENGESDIIIKNGAKDAALDKDIVLVFNEEMQEWDNFSGIELSYLNGKEKVIADNSISMDGNKLIISAPFELNKKYSLSIPAGAIADMAENVVNDEVVPNVMKAFKFSFSTTDAAVLKIKSANVKDNAKTVKVNLPVSVTFSKFIYASDFSSVKLEKVSLDAENSEVPIECSIINGNSLVIKPADMQKLEYNAVYRLTVGSEAVIDGAGNMIANDYVLNFTTEPDKYGPVVTGSMPQNNQLDTPLQPHIVIMFDEILDSTFKDLKKISIKADNKAITLSEDKIIVEGSMVMINIFDILEPGTNYSITISSGFVRDKAEKQNLFKGTYSLSFTTAVEL